MEQISPGKSFSEAFGQAFYQTPGVPGSGSGSTLGAMFGTFNAALLAVGVFWFSYNITAATVQTAEGGEFMGQRFSTIWFPIRFIVGISTLVPMFGGIVVLKSS
jgi:defect-in-organelle-trafficking protein DotA